MEADSRPAPTRGPLTVGHQLARTLVCALLAVASGCDAPRTGPSPGDRRRSTGEVESPPPIGSRRTTVKIGTIHHRDDGKSSGPFSFRRGRRTVEIRAAHLVTAAVELHACEQGRDGRDGFEDSSAWRNVRELLLPPAHAHVTGTALRLGTPYVDALTGPVDRARLYGAIAPPIGTYCRVYAVLAPADRDAVRAGGVAAETIRGHTLVVRGRYRSSPDDPWTSFTWRSDARRAVELEAVDPSTGEHPLGLNKPDGQTMLLIDKKLSGKVFDVPVDADDAGDRVLDNLADTLRMYTY